MGYSLFVELPSPFFVIVETRHRPCCYCYTTVVAPSRVISHFVVAILYYAVPLSSPLPPVIVSLWWFHPPFPPPSLQPPVPPKKYHAFFSKYQTKKKLDSICEFFPLLPPRTNKIKKERKRERETRLFAFGNKEVRSEAW